jgi:DNA-binding protein HU-beta
VNKRELIRKIAEDASLTNVQAAKALDAFLDSVQTCLTNGGRVTLVGFGTFAVSHRKARMVRDPKRGGTMRIAARTVARFAPGLDLKLAVENAAHSTPAPS